MMGMAHLAFCAFEAEEKSLLFFTLHKSNLSFFFGLHPQCGHQLSAEWAHVSSVVNLQRCSLFLLHQENVTFVTTSPWQM